ncbi:predicted protein [Nematostella vectensis]|uniref:G protein-coupled receptor GPR1/2/3 C-terminal domain-containing protein n=1 Tax=Nematostella vectensis TaxID=45351 RepID=A7SN55_NEMVE|nr:predicted protein [Nematostella vectensis]|eukprot:XP_001626933.1 predicted protein [Nematostella vectensis]
MNNSNKRAKVLDNTQTRHTSGVGNMNNSNKRTKVLDNTQTRHTSGVGNMNNSNKRTKVLDNTQTRHTSGVGNMNTGNKRTKVLDNTQTRHTSGVGNMNNGNKRTKTRHTSGVGNMNNSNKRTKVLDNTQTGHTSGVGNMNNSNKRTKVLDNTQTRHTSGVGNMNNSNKRTKVLDNTQTRHTSGVGNMNTGNKRTKVLDNTQTRHTSGVGNMNNGNKRTKRLILFLSIAAFLNAVAMFMGVLHPKPGAQCIFQAWWLSFFDYALLLWVCCITFNLYRNAINKVRTEHFENWIADNSEDVSLWRFMIWYVPLFICILAMFATYAYIFISYRKQAKSWGGTYSAEDERNKAMMKEHVRPLMAYPCIYLATSIFPLIHRIYNASTSTPSFPLLLLHVISTPLIGALNAVFFGIDKETLGRLNWPQMKVAFQQHSKTRKPLVREYPVGDTTETRPNDDSSWGSTGSSDARDTHAPPTLQPPTVHITGPTPPSSHRGSTNEITRDE